MTNQFQKEEKVVYANQKCRVLFSNGTTTKLIAENEPIHHFEFNDPETGEHRTIETNTIHCDTESIFLKPIHKEAEL